MNRAVIPFRVDGAVAVIVGGGGGIGGASARALAAAGARIVAIDRDAANCTDLVSEIAADGAGARAVAADVTDEAAVETAMADVIAGEGRIDILVNSAGIAIRKPAIELGLADWEAVMAVNATAAFISARTAARSMIADGHGGAIVNIASIFGLSGGGLYPNVSYQTSKGAMVNMTRALAVEWAPHRIRVNAVAPTYVRTALTASLLEQPEMVDRIAAMTPLGRLATVDEVAAAVVFLASPAAAMVTGHVLPVDGGFLAQ